MLINLKGLATEERNPRTKDLDTMSPLQLAKAMNDEDGRTVRAVRAVLPQVAQAIKMATEALACGGRIIYLGAGTSGRLGVLDASECPPTFGVPAGKVVGLIAGGYSALINAAEGAEDSTTEAREQLEQIGACPSDVVIGIAASGRTPYVVYGLRHAHMQGISTVAIADVADSKIGKEADLAIEMLPGPEVLTGSTRLKAGTTQKLVLNMISTGAMVGVGKAYQNLMVDMVQSNEKLRSRVASIVMEATGCDVDAAQGALEATGGKAKAAIVMILCRCGAQEAQRLLKQAQGHVRKAIKLGGYGKDAD